MADKYECLFIFRLWFWETEQQKECPSLTGGRGREKCQRKNPELPFSFHVWTQEFNNKFISARPTSKVLCHEMDNIFGSKILNLHFLGVPWWFPRSFNSFLSCYINITFLFASMKLLTSFEDAYFLHWIGRCSPASTPHWTQWNALKFIVLGGLKFNFTRSQVASCMHFQGKNLRCRVSEEIWFWYFQQQSIRNFCDYTKSTFNRPSKRLFIWWHNPFKMDSAMTTCRVDSAILLVGDDQKKRRWYLISLGRGVQRFINTPFIYTRFREIQRQTDR